MDKRNEEKLIRRELEDIINSGYSNTIKVNKIVDSINALRYKDEKKFIFILQGLIQEKMQGDPIKSGEKIQLESYNEAVEENNFAVQIAISSLMNLDEEK